MMISYLTHRGSGHLVLSQGGGRLLLSGEVVSGPRYAFTIAIDHHKCDSCRVFLIYQVSPVDLSNLRLRPELPPVHMDPEAYLQMSCTCLGTVSNIPFALTRTLTFVTALPSMLEALLGVKDQGHSKLGSQLLPQIPRRVAVKIAGSLW